MDPHDPASLPLRDIHLPPAIGWWPPAPGWWAVLLACGLLAASLGFWLRHRRRLALRFRVMAELDGIEKRYQHSEDQQHLLRDLSALLRRIVLTRAPRGEVASLYGQAWLQFLQTEIDDPRLDDEFGELFTAGPYRPVVEFDIEELVAAVRDWAQRLTTAQRE